MTTHVEPIPSYERTTSNDYRERLKREAETALFHPALYELLTIAADDGLASPEAISLLSDSSNKDEYATAVATLTQTIFDRRRGTGIERYQLTDKALSSRIIEAVRRTVEALNMTTEVPVPKGSFEIAAVLGATAAPVAKRTNYLYDALEKETAAAPMLVGLGAERPLRDGDTKYVDLYPYIEEAKVETDLLAHAARDWFKLHGYSVPIIDPSVPAEVYTKDATLGSRYRIQTVTFEDDARKPCWSPSMIINLSPPFDKSHHPRATTGETIQFLLELADFQPGDKLLLASSQPYLAGQKFETQRLCLDAGIEVEVAGYGIDCSGLSGAALGDEIAKATTKAAALYTALQ